MESVAKLSFCHNRLHQFIVPLRGNQTCVFRMVGKWWFASRQPCLMEVTSESQPLHLRNVENPVGKVVHRYIWLIADML